MKTALLFLALVAVAQAAPLNVSWRDNSTNETAFELERSTDGRTFALLARLPRNTTAYSDRTVSPRRTYHYRVRAVNDSGASAYSPVVIGTAPGAGGNVRAKRIEVREIRTP